MRRIILVLLLLAAAGTLVGMAVVQHPGYVLFAYKGFRYESSLWAFLALVAVVVLLLWLVRALLTLVFVSGGVVNPWSRRNARRRVRLASEQGLLDLAEGRWARALRHLRRAAEADPQPLMYYLGAARAANRIGQYEESDQLLERALERQPQAELAIALAHAELQQERGETDAALETLKVMQERHPRHHQVLRQLLQLYRQRGDSAALVGLLPDLRKNKALPESELNQLELSVWSDRLVHAGQAGLNEGETALNPLIQAWQHLSAAQRAEPRLVLAFADQLRHLGAEPEAEEAVRIALKRGYDDALVRFYGRLRGADPARQLQTAEAFLKDHPTDPALFLTLGRLCLQNSLWGKAREYFDTGLSFSREPELCAEQARLLAQMGELERSNQLFQEGLVQHLPALPLPGERVA
ncbi:heme biosynthesis protein HemY [Pseudomonas tohonis]|uniref:Heme biosynthesis protein HemY n=1 Tax=Pseudomonas tohonis TaxID=2725477 RepID=A0A6J4DXK7_9PSED|nr:heme biosynthesis HemY N-terminal domain-containing protein [Pseudomonas tohonis]BCG22160.1 heme biosynthesis protein HemY [Pseudomonas tohonis]GJN55199.1 heme biosynthesis protein HemY [Pseudomonas tohonis]